MNREYVRYPKRSPNEQGSRHVLNHKLLQEEIEHSFGSHIENGQVTYLSSFNNLTMKQQVQFMSQIDILLSPHGAQLTSIPYMPDCGSVLELFPKGFYLPYWYGPLAASANLHHSAIYTGGGSDIDFEIETANYTIRKAMKRRKRAICPNIPTVIETLATLIDQWKNCTCRSSSSSSSNGSSGYHQILPHKPLPKPEDVIHLKRNDTPYDGINGY